VAEALVTVEGVSKSFDSGGPFWRRRRVLAVDGVDLEVWPGETLGIVGESGSGKSTLLRLILRLLRPDAGRVLFEGRDLGALSRGELRRVRRRMQAVFQDPAASFNPRQPIGRALLAPLEVHHVGTRRSRLVQVGETLEMVGLNTGFMARFPHQLSGGQCQRAAIARAIILRPALVLADEPTSALDVSVQAQILNLLKETKRELGLTTIFVSHNLGVVRYVADRVAVMYLGRIVETGPSHDVFSKPSHEYTRALLNAVPEADPGRRRPVMAAPG
jgi:ABC-type glutathione transport system ATPase component